MGPQDIEQLLQSAKYKHLADVTLVAYRDSQLDEIALALADAHLRLCIICDRRLTFLKEEAEALAITETLVTRATGYVQTEIDRLSSHLNDLLGAWVLSFSGEAVRGTVDGDELWRYESEDGLLTAWIVLGSDASLTVHFSSPEVAWDGALIEFRLGPFSKEVTLERQEDSSVAARIEIPRAERARDMADLSVRALARSAGA